ncbi:MAG: arylamine N-acetyltransferase [Gammaproteobacteria bacterium]|nr:MAG: arylamine N-acetyltransferase [Gammaproteobacteria bacterium]
MVHRQPGTGINSLNSHKSTTIKPQTVTVKKYLDRIGYQGSLAPNLSTLNQLHLTHMLAVPFENLDISLNRQISLELPAILHKIVNLGRGGFCYELNYAFAWLLGELGFSVELLSASTFDGKSLGPEFDHMLLRVEADQPVFADVGFGDSFLLPIFPAHKPVLQFDRYYRVESNGTRWILEQRFEVGDWKPLYIFDLKSHQISEFETMCQYHQTNEASNFTRRTVCSRATEQGRITCANNRFIVTEAGHREESIIEDKIILEAILMQRFGITLNTKDLQGLLSVLQTQEAVKQ